VLSGRDLLKLRAEVEVMQQLGVSLNAVHLHDVFEDDVNVHMVMELCEGGALLERIESGVYSEKYISVVVRSILRFIAQCHAKVSSLSRILNPEDPTAVTWLFGQWQPQSTVRAALQGMRAECALCIMRGLGGASVSDVVDSNRSLVFCPSGCQGCMSDHTCCRAVCMGGQLGWGLQEQASMLERIPVP